MVDNFSSAGTNGDADDEMPAPYGTGPKNRTTEEHHRSEYGYAEADSGDGGWRERSTALDGLDPAPSLPNAPRSYERGPVPQQPYVPKPPFLPPQDREYPTPSGYQQQYSEPTYGESAPAWGEREQYREPTYDESPFAPRPPYQERPTQERPMQERPTHEQRPQQFQDRGYPPEQGQSPRPQQPPQNPFAPGRNNTGALQPPNRPAAPGAGTAPAGPPQQAPRPPAPGPAGSNGRSSNGHAAPPPPSPLAAPPSSNGVASSNGLGSNGLGSNGHGSNGLSNPSTPPSNPRQGPPAQPGGFGQGNGPQQNGQSGPGQGRGERVRPGQSVPDQRGAGNTGAMPLAASNGPSSTPGQGSTGWSGQAPTTGSALPSPASTESTGYPSDPSAEYESNAPVSSAPPSSGRPAGARRRADVQQDAPSQVQAEPVSSHRARRAQGSGTTPTRTAAPVTNSTADSSSSTSGASGSSSTPGGDSKRPRRYRIHHLRDMKNRGEKWAMLTAYDQYTAEIFDQSGIPVLLVGDSAANNVFGYESTLRVTVDELIPLARAVAGAVERALVVADLPFGSYQASPEQAFHTAVRFMKEAGVHAVKLEGGRNMVPAVEKLTQAGIPVMAHIGFTPQSEHSIGGYRVQGRGDQAAGLIDDAVALAEAGAFSVVLEMVPGDVSAEITKRIPVPTIGIGAGRETDAQVLVWQDMAGLRSGPMPRFVKQYADLRGILTNAATTFAAEVTNGTFPTDEHTF